MIKNKINYLSRKDHQEIFQLNSAYIKFLFESHIRNIYYFTELLITFYDRKDEYVLYKDFAIANFNTFISLLELAIDGKLQLHDSINPNFIQKDIGYLWNEELQGKDLVNYEIKGVKYWVGNKYLLWQTPGDSVNLISTWLYNNDNKIFLEISPDYKWHYTDHIKGEILISYEEFIKNYRPYAILEISEEIARYWLQKAKFLLEIIEINEKKYRCKGENCEICKKTKINKN